jgi:hypothetical protein
MQTVVIFYDTSLSSLAIKEKMSIPLSHLFTKINWNKNIFQKPLGMMGGGFEQELLDQRLVQFWRE